MIPANIEIECPECNKKQLKQLNVCMIGTQWSVGTTFICALPENGEDGGCGATIAINYRCQLEYKLTVIDSRETQRKLI